MSAILIQRCPGAVKAMLRDATTKMIVRRGAGERCGCLICADCPFIASWTVSFTGIHYDCAANCLREGFQTTEETGFTGPQYRKFHFTFDFNSTVTLSTATAFRHECQWGFMTEVGTVETPCSPLEGYGSGYIRTIYAIWNLIRTDSPTTEWVLTISLLYDFFEPPLPDPGASRYFGGLVIFHGTIADGTCPDDLIFTNADPTGSGVACSGTGGTGAATPDV